MEEAEQIASRIKAALSHLKVGSLRFWGEWFGGRAYETALKIIDCDARDEVLHMQFDGGESLYLWSPQQAELDHQMLRIQNVARVHLEWFHYGRPKTDQNWYFIDFTRTDHRIDSQNNFGGACGRHFGRGLSNSSSAACCSIIRGYAF